MMVSLATHHSRFNTIAKQMAHWMEVFNTGTGRCCPPGTWTPSVNLYEDAAGYHVVVELAGVDASDMELRVEKGVLEIQGRRDTPQPAQAKGRLTLHLMEIDHGAFCRTLKLPSDVNAGGIEATYRNGLLWIRIPKKA
jgi:HSP20 family protein